MERVSIERGEHDECVDEVVRRFEEALRQEVGRDGQQGAGDVYWQQTEAAALSWALARHRREKLLSRYESSEDRFLQASAEAWGSSVSEESLRRVPKRTQGPDGVASTSPVSTRTRRMTFDRSNMPLAKSEKVIMTRREFWCQLITFGLLYVVFLAFALLVVLPYLMEPSRPHYHQESTERLRAKGHDLPNQRNTPDPSTYSSSPPPDQPPTFARRNEVFYQTTGSHGSHATSITPTPNARQSDSSCSQYYVHKDRVVKENFFPTAAYNSVEIFSDNSAGGILWISLAHATLISKADAGHNATAAASSSSSSNVDRQRLHRRPMREFTRGFHE